MQAGGLAASLAAYGYRDVLEALGKPDGGIAAAADVQARVDAALAEPGLVVVHLLTHGLQGPGRGVLYVLGPDGAEVPTSVGEWLNRAEKRGGDCGPVLFVLDVCHAGAAVGYQLQQLVDAERQQAWVLAAASGADPAYDGRLTRALTQVLDGFRSGELRVDPSVRYIPLRKLFSEVDRLVREQSRGSYPQQIHSSYVPLHVDIDQLEFFPNPGWVRPSRATTPAARWPLTWLRCWMRRLTRGISCAAPVPRSRCSGRSAGGSSMAARSSCSSCGAG